MDAFLDADVLNVNLFSLFRLGAGEYKQTLKLTKAQAKPDVGLCRAQASFKCFGLFTWRRHCTANPERRNIWTLGTTYGHPLSVEFKRRIRSESLRVLCPDADQRNDLCCVYRTIIIRSISEVQATLLLLPSLTQQCDICCDRLFKIWLVENNDSRTYHWAPHQFRWRRCHATPHQSPPLRNSSTIEQVFIVKSVYAMCCALETNTHLSAGRHSYIDDLFNAFNLFIQRNNKWYTVG